MEISNPPFIRSVPPLPRCWYCGRLAHHRLRCILWAMPRWMLIAAVVVGSWAFCFCLVWIVWRVFKALWRWAC